MAGQWSPLQQCCAACDFCNEHLPVHVA